TRSSGATSARSRGPSARPEGLAPGFGLPADRQDEHDQGQPGEGDDEDAQVSHAGEGIGAVRALFETPFGVLPRLSPGPGTGSGSRSAAGRSPSPCAGSPSG